MNLLISVYTLLWTLLFIIPGLVKAYSYAMTPYIMAEHPFLTANEAITESRRIMDGNKWRLLCLDFSLSAGNCLVRFPCGSVLSASEQLPRLGCYGHFSYFATVRSAEHRILLRAPL